MQINKLEKEKQNKSKGTRTNYSNNDEWKRNKCTHKKPTKPRDGS